MQTVKVDALGNSEKQISADPAHVLRPTILAIRFWDPATYMSCTDGLRAGDTTGPSWPGFWPDRIDSRKSRAAFFR